MINVSVSPVKHCDFKSLAPVLKQNVPEETISAQMSNQNAPAKNYSVA